MSCCDCLPIFRRLSNSAPSSNAYCTNVPYQPLTSEQGFHLLQLQVIFRHGVRTPINFVKGLPVAVYDKSLENDLPETIFDYRVVNAVTGVQVFESDLEPDLRFRILKGGCRASILTTLGQEQMFELGKMMRKAYLQELNLLDYSEKYVRVRTTNLDRTIKSLRCLMAGLFGAKELSKAGPIIFPVKSAYDEDMFPNKLSCSAMKAAMDIALANVAELPNMKNDRAAILKALGQPPDVYCEFGCLRDDLVCREVHGMAYPEALIPFQKVIENNAATTIHAIYSGRVSTPFGRFSVTKLAIGKFLRSILAEVERACLGVETAKLYLYSAHDTTLVPLLQVLGIWNEIWPPFASNIIFEVYSKKDDNSCYIRVLYNGEARQIGYQSKYLINFHELMEILTAHVISNIDYQQVCGAHYYF